MTQLDIVVTCEDDESTDAAVRRLIRDLAEIDAVDSVDRGAVPAQPGDRGIVEDLSGIVVSLLNAGGAAMVLEAIRHFLPSSGSVARARKVEVVTADGERILLEGAMTDVEFLATRDRLLAMLEKA